MPKTSFNFCMATDKYMNGIIINENQNNAIKSYTVVPFGCPVFVAPLDLNIIMCGRCKWR